MKIYKVVGILVYRRGEPDCQWRIREIKVTAETDRAYICQNRKIQKAKIGLIFSLDQITRYAYVLEKGIGSAKENIRKSLLEEAKTDKLKIYKVSATLLFDQGKSTYEERVREYEVIKETEKSYQHKDGRIGKNEIDLLKPVPQYRNSIFIMGYYVFVFENKVEMAKKVLKEKVIAEIEETQRYVNLHKENQVLFP